MDPRAYTKKEVTQFFLGEVHRCVEFWAALPDKTAKERCEGVASSLLAVLDGSTNFPSVNLLIHPDERDKADCQEQGENWFEDGMVFNEEFLNDEYCETYL